MIAADAGKLALTVDDAVAKAPFAGDAALFAVVTVMIFATEGVPLELSINNMYGPGGHTLPVAGIVKFKVLPLTVKLSGIRR